MQLAPGPIPQLSSDWFDATPDKIDFTGLVTAALSGADDVEGGLDFIFDWAVPIADTLPPDAIMSDLDTIDAITGQAAPLAGQWQIDPIESAKFQGDAAIIDAYGATPGEAFTPVPPATDYGQGVPPAVYAGFVSITLRNLTRPGYPDFMEGEQFAIDVAIDPNGLQLDQYYKVSVEMDPWTETGPRPHVQLGETDLFGKLTYQGQWITGDSGNWGATFYTTTTKGAMIAGPTLSWIVSPPLPAPGSGVTRGTPRPFSLVTVTLTNATTGNAQVFHVGDTWNLVVTGPAGADVDVAALKDGVSLVPVTLGQTDASGTYKTSGTFTAADVGAWQEYYVVGRFSWPGNLQFTVS